MKKAFLQLHFAVFLAGFTGVLGRLITLNEGWLVWYRLLISSVTMWIVFSLAKKLQRVSIKDILRLAGIGFLSALHWVSFYGSIKYANVSVALVCFSAPVFLQPYLNPFFSKRKINVIEVLLGLIVIAGIYIIFHFDPKYKTGIILGVICAYCLHCYDTDPPVCTENEFPNNTYLSTKWWIYCLSLVHALLSKAFPTSMSFPGLVTGCGYWCLPGFVQCLLSSFRSMHCKS
jgi:EamA-like transporter family.